MGSILRTVLLWLMAIALPVQGMAASAMLVCGPSHERMTQSVGSEAHEAVHAIAHHQAAANPAGPTADAHHAVDTDDTGADASGKFTDLGKYKCSACAACCSMLALPAGVAWLGEPGLVNAIPGAPAAAAPSYLTEGIERPPRALFA